MTAHAFGSMDDEIPPLALEGVDPLSLRVFTAFMAMFRANHQVMSRAFSEEGSHPAQGGCLIALARNDGLSQRELADRLHLTPPTITAMLQRMEKAGIVVRQPDADDQRLMRVHLTDAGRHLEGEVRNAVATHINRVIGALSEADRSELARLLELMAGNIRDVLATTVGDAEAPPTSHAPPQAGRASPARASRARPATR